jgi:glycosyltransferase involved in cell wall biosynthesis
VPPTARVKIAHVVIGGDVAGGQLVALQLARAARAAGHECLFVAPATGSFTELVEREQFPVLLATLGRTFDLPAAWRLARTLRRNRVDVVHTHTHLAGTVLGRLAGRAAGARVVTHAHIENVFNRRPAIAAAQRRVDVLTARLSAAIVAVSEQTRRSLIAEGVSADAIETIPNGVAPRTPGNGGSAIRAELAIPPDALLIGSVGRLCDVKGQRELLHALAGLGDAWLVLVGRDLELGGRYERQLREEADALGVGGRTVFAGYREDVPDVLEALDLFALPSWVEGMPLVVLEAMAAGVPVVATAVGGTPELVVDGETALLVRPRETAELTDALRALLDDEARRRAMGNAGRRRVEERFAEATTTGRVLQIYDDIAARVAATGK